MKEYKFMICKKDKAFTSCIPVKGKGNLEELKEKVLNHYEGYYIKSFEEINNEDETSDNS